MACLFIAIWIEYPKFFFIYEGVDRIYSISYYFYDLLNSRHDKFCFEELKKTSIWNSQWVAAETDHGIFNKVEERKSEKQGPEIP
jgi:hypothetical protein